ncbi:WecB/TagA/CpsF family glycosyltransferase [Rhizobium herbae]|uniref:Exopolysaccharide biosynthesis WecB/TagA/CpsF family protein n=1 Tax=Rhizobium herbae TaxID=508661 RepID=A0ABS4EQY8_9HYPH|nr:WecB/TagA/CpsF family glycosyltransferase [Rhizobium herbae]MBP1860370.1 exopolysaccharide biosynthesis WecB/TagA/CpsF family protein [Rhizobium herbae]
MIGINGSPEEDFDGTNTIKGGYQADRAERSGLPMSTTGSDLRVNGEDTAQPRETVSFLQENLFTFPSILLGGLPITVLDRQSAAFLMISAARKRRPDKRPYYFTSANGEVIARVHTDARIASLFQEADQIFADGQPLVFASRWLCRIKLPERVATTDLFHDVARLAEFVGITFYLLGATEAESNKAVAAIRVRYPNLRVIGHCHGYLAGDALEAKLDEINALAPDILWLGLGVPREQIFVRDFAARLTNVGVVKTSGGLFDHLAGKTLRAPLWAQRAGFEWLWRVLMEPRRLFWRYMTTNPQALYLIWRYSK